MSEEIAGAALGVVGAFGLVLLQRWFDKQHQARQQLADDKAAREAEVLVGVIEVWTAGAVFIYVAGLISDPVVRRWRWGALVAPELLELQRVARDLIAAATRLYLVADDELIAATWKVLDAAQVESGLIGGAPWWRPGLLRTRRVALQARLDDLTGALLDLRDVARVQLGRELPNLPDLGPDVTMVRES